MKLLINSLTLSFIFVLFAFSLPVHTASEQFKLGIENLQSSFITYAKNLRIALVTNQTGKDQGGRRSVDILLSRGLKIKAIFVPEHGFDGKQGAMEAIDDSVDQKTGLPIFSLYQRDRGKEINKKMVHDFDAFMFDMQDVGMRHYTYISTLFTTMQAAAKFSKKYIILDRPNLLGAVMEGPLVDVTLNSFISIAPIPLRHGMTVGELGAFFNRHFFGGVVDLFVVPLDGYKRGILMKDSSFTFLSPNIQSLQSCYGYSFLGLLGEICPFEVGVGTEKSFCVLLLPEKLNIAHDVWQKAQKLLEGRNILSIPYSTYHEKKKKKFVGLELAIADINKVNAFDVFLELVQLFIKSGLTVDFSRAFDKAVGTKSVRLYCVNESSKPDLSHVLNTKLKSFFNKARPSLLYKPFPRVAYL